MMARAASGVVAATVARPRCLLVQTSNSAAPALSAVSVASQFWSSSSAARCLGSSDRRRLDQRDEPAAEHADVVVLQVHGVGQRELRLGLEHFHDALEPRGIGPLVEADPALVDRVAGR